MTLLTKIKGLIPNEIRKFFFKLRNFGLAYTHPDSLNSLKRKINIYYSLPFSKRNLFSKEIDFLNKQSCDINSFVFPYEFVKKYNPATVSVEKDPAKNLFFVLHNEHRLYYSSKFKTREAVAENYSSICMEQDADSPHKYLTKEFDIEPGSIVVDLGAAEGNFSLDVVEEAKELFILEADPVWIEALEATFAPWKDKVKIINKYVSDKNDDIHITLEEILKEKPVDFIKLDVEGAELSILKSSSKVFERNQSLKLAICTYHRQNDAVDIERILHENDFKAKFSNGYVLFVHDSLKPPFFRRNLIRASK